MKTVFVLDDDYDNAFVLERWLNKHQCQVSIFNKSADLFTAMNEENPDVILLDYRISEPGDGVTVCRHLRGELGFTNKVFLMSASIIPGDKIEMCDFDGFIEKPYELNDLLTLISGE